MRSVTRILIAMDDGALLDKGEVARLQVCLRQLGDLLPDAVVDVTTPTPWLLRVHAPRAHPVTWSGAGDIRRSGSAGTRLRRSIPQVALSLALDIRADRVLRRTSWRPRRPSTTGTASGLGEFDFVIALGGAWLTNRDPSSTRRTLDLLAAAADAGLPTAVLAGTVGLLADPQLRRRTENILARVGPIALREPLVGARNLAELGVPSDRMVVTGDAALDLARDEPPIPMGRGIGVCAGLAEVANGEEFIGTIRRALHDSAASRGAPIVEMAVNQGDDDEYRATRRLTLGYPQVVREEWSSRSPAAILRRVSRVPDRRYGERLRRSPRVVTRHPRRVAHGLRRRHGGWSGDAVAVR